MLKLNINNIQKFNKKKINLMKLTFMKQKHKQLGFKKFNWTSQ